MRTIYSWGFLIWPLCKYFPSLLKAWEHFWGIEEVTFLGDSTVLCKIVWPNNTTEVQPNNLAEPNVWYRYMIRDFTHDRIWQGYTQIFFRIMAKAGFHFFEMAVHWKVEKIHWESAKEGSRKHFSIYVLKRCAYVASSGTIVVHRPCLYYTTARPRLAARYTNMLVPR